MIQTKEGTKCVVERAPGPAFMLIAKNANNRIEVLTLERDGEEILPVFSHEEEAGMFLQLAGVIGWRVRRSSAGELISVLYGSCAKVQQVALDPLPEMMTEMTVGLVSLDRGRFIEHITTGRRRSSLRDISFESPSCQGKQERAETPRMLKDSPVTVLLAETTR